MVPIPEEAIIPLAEYRALIADRTMLDMILASMGDDGAADKGVVDSAAWVREHNGTRFERG